MADDLALPSPVALARHAERARSYAEAAKAGNTRRAYAADWRHFTGWCRGEGVFDPGPDPQLVGLYLAACAAPDRKGRAGASPATLERRLAGIAWVFDTRGTPLDRRDPHIREVLKGIRRVHGRPPQRKEATLGDDIRRMLDTLPTDLPGLRDRAILLVGFAGGLRRSEIVGLDRGPAETMDGAGHVDILPEGLLVFIKGKTGWREVAIGRGSSERTCPVHALETWLSFARIGHGPLFRRVGKDRKTVGADRLSDKHVARLVKAAVLKAGIRGDLSETERVALFSGHSLRAGLATSADAPEAAVQKQLGHASPEMTRIYQRQRDRFRLNLTKAAGL